MKRFVTKKALLYFAVFIVAVKLLDLLCFTVINYFYQHTYVGQNGGDLNKYLHDPNPPELVIMGSSVAKFQIDPDSLPKRSCNLARSMTTECYQLGMLDLMIQKNKVPKYILLSLWPQNYLSQEGEEEKQSEDILFLKYYYDQSAYISREINQISPFERVKYFFNSYRFNGNLSNIFQYFMLTKQKGNEKYYFYYEPVTIGDSLNTVLAASKRKEIAAKAGTLHLSERKSSYLSRLIDTCQKYKIQLLCYYLPQYKEDYSKLRPGIEFAQRITKEKGVPFYYFTPESSPEILNNPALWADGEHLNKNGAVLQNRKLSTFINASIK